MYQTHSYRDIIWRGRSESNRLCFVTFHDGTRNRARAVPIRLAESNAGRTRNSGGGVRNIFNGTRPRQRVKNGPVPRARNQYSETIVRVFLRSFGSFSLVFQPRGQHNIRVIAVHGLSLVSLQFSSCASTDHRLSFGTIGDSYGAGRRHSLGGRLTHGGLAS